MNGGSEDKVSKVSNLWASPSRGLEHPASLLSLCGRKTQARIQFSINKVFFKKKKNEEKGAILMPPI